MWSRSAETGDAAIFDTLVLVVQLLALVYAVGWLRRVYKQSRFETYARTTLARRYEAMPRLERFTIKDPYAGLGEYRKAQLHLHTSNSVDVREKVPVVETVRRYKEAGYSFVVITDHDRVTECPALDDQGFVAIAGEERTLPAPIWPLGKHLLRIGADASFPDRQELLAPSHLNWRGNFGSGRWFLPDLVALGDFQLLEIFNGKSHSLLDFWMWHKLIEARGPERPVWGIAVDDSDNARPLDEGWVMVKTASVSREALFEALRSGAFYATTGPSAAFQVEDDAITAETVDGAWIRFIDAKNDVVGVARGDRAAYRPVGDEGFIRVEIVGKSGRAAWSQPFFLVATPD